MCILVYLRYITIFKGRRKVSMISMAFLMSCKVTNLCNKELLCITHTVEHNYISPSSTVGIQLHVSALYVGHLHVVI